MFSRTLRKACIKRTEASNGEEAKEFQPGVQTETTAKEHYFAWEAPGNGFLQILSKQRAFPSFIYPYPGSQEYVGLGLFGLRREIIGASELTLFPNMDMLPVRLTFGTGRHQLERARFPANMLKIISLREQVYYYLREEMHLGRLLPGQSIDLARIAAQLGISKTPLRDALIQLEAEGFVDIIPRRGVRVAALSLTDVKNLYDMIGIIEGGIIVTCFHKADSELFDRLQTLNDEMRQAVDEEDFDRYYNLNLEFHGAVVGLSDNEEMKRQLLLMKQRLYDFPRRRYIKEWEQYNCGEHQEMIESFRRGDPDEACRVLRDAHWSYRVQEKYIKSFYSKVAAQLEAEKKLREDRNT